MTKQFIDDWTVYSCLNRSPVIKPFTCDQTVHSWPNRPLRTKPFTQNCSPVNKKNNNNIPGDSIIVVLSVTALWLWHFLGSLYDWHFLWPHWDCETSLDLYEYEACWSLFMIMIVPGPFMIVILPVPLYDCVNFLCLFMIVTLPEPLWLYHTAWLWNILVYNLFYCCHYWEKFDISVLQLTN